MMFIYTKTANKVPFLYVMQCYRLPFPHKYIVFFLFVSRPCFCYITVTLFARFLGLSGLSPIQSEVVSASD